MYTSLVTYSKGFVYIVKTFIVRALLHVYHYLITILFENLHACLHVRARLNTKAVLAVTTAFSFYILVLETGVEFDYNLLQYQEVIFLD